MALKINSGKYEMKNPELLKLRKEAIRRKKALMDHRRAMTFDEKIKELEDIMEWVAGFKTEIQDRHGSKSEG